MSTLQSLKRWFDDLPALARWPVFVFGVAALNALLVFIICLIVGAVDAVSLSNGFFYDSALILLVALVLYFANRQTGRPSLRELTRGEPLREAAEPEQEQEKEKEKPRPNPMPFYATALFLVGLAVFGLSILVTYLAGLI